MLTEAMLALAAAGGTAVVQAAGTEAWGSVSEGVARMFRRRSGDGAEDGAQRELERTALVLASDEAEGSSRQASLWGQRFAVLLSDADEQGRRQAETELRQLISLASGAAGQRQVLDIHDNRYDNSPVQYGNGNHQRFHYGSDR
ncbi:hypothetical protein ACFWM7_07875 [Streptomyces sp. NPDC058375]|uniref:hypothetical protein n=1 Tax=Streptomyces sp. NPDC058375 TaxID=3346467 RepID=UPI003650BD03